MSVFIELETDPFSEVFSEESHNTKAMSLPKPVRRPMRGLQVKPDTYSYIKVVDSGGNPIPLVDAGGEKTDNQGRGVTDYYTNLLIQQVAMNRVEKQQVLETFGSDYIYFYGESPRVYTIQARLLNTMDFNWFNEFWYNYENYLRGSKLVERGARAYIFNDDLLWECYLLNLSATKNAVDKNSVPIQFTVFVINEALVSSIGDPKFPNYPGNENIPLQNIEAYDRLLAQYKDNRNIYWDTARTSSFIHDLYTMLTTGQLTYSTKFKRNPNVPLRGMIRDNYDEYIGMAGPSKAYFDQKDLDRMMLLHEIKDFFELSSIMLKWMGSIGGALSSGSPLEAWGTLTASTSGFMSGAGSLL